MGIEDEADQIATARRTENERYVARAHRLEDCTRQFSRGVESAASEFRAAMLRQQKQAHPLFIAVSSIFRPRKGTEYIEQLEEEGWEVNFYRSNGWESRSTGGLFLDRTAGWWLFDTNSWRKVDSRDDGPFQQAAEDHGVSWPKSFSGAAYDVVYVDDCIRSVRSVLASVIANYDSRTLPQPSASQNQVATGFGGSGRTWLT